MIKPPESGIHSCRTRARFWRSTTWRTRVSSPQPPSPTWACPTTCAPFLVGPLDRSLHSSRFSGFTGAGGHVKTLNPKSGRPGQCMYLVSHLRLHSCLLVALLLPPSSGQARRLAPLCSRALPWQAATQWPHGSMRPAVSLSNTKLDKFAFFLP